MRRNCLAALAGTIVPVMIWVDDPVAKWAAAQPIRLTDGIAGLSLMLVSLGAAFALLIASMALLATTRQAGRRPGEPLRHHGQTATLVLVSAAASLGTAALLKHLIGRIRPSAFGADPWRFEPLAFDDRFAALPSAQAACLAAIVLSLSMQLPRWRLPLLAVGAAACLARVLAGAHWPSDVVAGWLLGAAMAFVTQLGLIRRQNRLGSRRS